MAEQPKSGIATLADRARDMFRRVVEYPDPDIVMADQVNPSITPQTYSDLYKGSIAAALSIPGETGAALKPAIPVLPKTGSLSLVRLASEVLQPFPTTEPITQFAVDKGLITRETAESPAYFGGQFLSLVPAGAITYVSGALPKALRAMKQTTAADKPSPPVAEQQETFDPSRRKFLKAAGATGVATLLPFAARKTFQRDLPPVTTRLKKRGIRQHPRFNNLLEKKFMSRSDLQGEMYAWLDKNQKMLKNQHGIEIKIIDDPRTMSGGPEIQTNEDLKSVVNRDLMVKGPKGQSEHLTDFKVRDLFVKDIQKRLNDPNTPKTEKDKLNNLIDTLAQSYNRTDLSLTQKLDLLKQEATLRPIDKEYSADLNYANYVGDDEIKLTRKVGKYNILDLDTFVGSAETLTRYILDPAYRKTKTLTKPQKALLQDLQEELVHLRELEKFSKNKDDLADYIHQKFVSATEGDFDTENIRFHVRSFGLTGNDTEDLLRILRREYDNKVKNAVRDHNMTPSDVYDFDDIIRHVKHDMKDQSNPIILPSKSVNNDSIVSDIARDKYEAALKAIDEEEKLYKAFYAPDIEDKFAEGGFVEKLKKLGSDIINYPDPNIAMADQAAPVPEVLKDPRTYIEAEKGAVAGTLGLPGDIGSMSEGVADYIQYMPTFLRAPVQTLMQLPTTEDVKEFGIEKGLLTREETEGVPFQVGEFFSPVSGAAAVKGAKVLSKFGPQAGKYISQEGLLAAERLMDKAPEVFQPRLNIVPEGPTTTTKATTSFRTVDPEGFYSVVQEAIPLIKRGKGTGQEFVDEMRTMAKKQGFPEKSFNNEIKAMGLNLDSRFTKEDFVQHLNDKRFTVDVVENKASELPSDESVVFNETETIGFEELPVRDKDYFQDEVKDAQRDVLRSSLEEDLSEGYSLSPKLDREAAFNKAAILKAFDENKTEFIDVNGNTQDFKDKIDSIAYDIAKENYEDFDRAYQRVPVVIDGDERFTLFRGGEDMPWELREGDGMLSENVVKTPDGEAKVSEDNLTEAQIQARLYLEEEGLVSFEGDGLGLEYMHRHALTDQVNVDGTQPNRREILITSPEVGDFKDHFTRTDDTVVSSVMASDWDGPIVTISKDLSASNEVLNPNIKVLYADEIQSDLAMANSRYGQKIKIIEADVLPLLDDLRYLSDELRKFQSSKLPPVTQMLQLLLSTTERANYRQFLRSEVKEIIDRAVTNIIDGVSLFDESINPEAVSGNILILADRLRTVIETDPFLYGSFSKNPRLNSILYGENTLSDKLTSAREKLKQIKGPSTNTPNPWQDTWHELALKKLMKTAVDEGYDYVMVPKSETLVAKWGPGSTEKAPEGAYRKMYQTVYDRKIPSFLKKYAKQYNSELIDAELGESGVSDLFNMSVPETTLIKITPEMKEAAKEGQPLFNIAVGTAAGVGALSTLDKEESEDTFAQGGVVRKRGIGTLNEIARTMFQRPRGVSGLSSVARNMFR